ncbi:MAG: phage tail tape measure C-terminal domain-containing protein [Pseudomonadota bacterium]
MNELENAADAVARLDIAPALQGADEMAQAFEAAGDRIARSLERAAQSGELSFNAMAESVLTDLARLAVSEIVEAPLNALVAGIGQAVSGRTGATTVNMNVTGAADPAGFRRSEGQIAGALARAVSAGRKRI